MIFKETTLGKECIKQTMTFLYGAIKTAPKSRGLNAIQTVVLTDKDKNKVAEKMKQYTKPARAFLRDSENLKHADAVLLVAVKTLRIGLNCGLCQYKDCRDNEKNKRQCIFNLVDLGIALGSAVSTAMNLKVDNRIMYTVGYAARDMNIFSKEYKIIMGIPVKYYHKNIFFDRK